MKEVTGRKTLSSEQVKALNAPLPSEAVHPHPTKNYLSTIKAIYVVERFNQVFGLGGWFINNEVIEKGDDGNIVIKATFQAPEYGIIVPDIFGGNDNQDRGDAFKGACTDALTKIGSYLGVGMDVYKGLHEIPKGQPKPAKKTQTEEKPAEATTEKGDFVSLMDKRGAELDELVGAEMYKIMLEKAGFKSAKDIKTRVSQGDLWKHTGSVIDLVKSMLNAEAVEYEPGKYRTPKCLAELEPDKRAKYFEKVQLVVGL
jgi:hypothetical protein